MRGLLATASTLALFHPGNDGAARHGFADAVAASFAHPFAGLDHLTAVLRLGLWSALTAQRVWPSTFAVTLLAGALLGWAGLTLLVPARWSAAA